MELFQELGDGDGGEVVGLHLHCWRVIQGFIYLKLKYLSSGFPLYENRFKLLDNGGKAGTREHTIARPPPAPRPPRLFHIMHYPSLYGPERRAETPPGRGTVAEVWDPAPVLKQD